MRSCPQCRKILDDSAIHCPDDGRELSAPNAQTGQILSGQYLVLDKVGEGASAEVYRAYQLGVKRVVAVKILTSSAASSAEFVSRFVREAQAAAHLPHPNIVTVYQIGKTQDGRPFIAMEWVSGGPMGRGQNSPHTGDYSAIISLAKQVASALGHAHRAGIIHRDLKPDNLLVATRNGEPQVTIVDFGIAKILDQGMITPGETHLTKFGSVYGTPQYLSPEQASAKAVDSRSDLYSLGVVLYELVCGELPFTTAGVVLLVDHLQTTPRNLVELAPEAPPMFCDLVMRLLAKDPSDRPANAAVLLAELDALTEAPLAEEDRPATLGFSVPEGFSAPIGFSAPRLSARRAPVAAALLSLAILALGSGALGSSASAQEKSSQKVPRALVEARAAQGPQRALMVSADGYALRVLVPQDFRAQEEHLVAIEVWDSAGRPVGLPSLVVRFADEDGNTEGISVPAVATSGRYEILRRFEESGRYSMEVLAHDGEMAFRVHLDVRESDSVPNS